MNKVLIVDDEQLILDGLERMIHKLSGFKVVGKLQNGQQAKNYLENHSVDIVFSDIRMPVTDGLELVRWLSVFRPESKVVLISAYRDFEYAQRAMNYGVRYYLTKPFRLPEVKKVVEQIMEERSKAEKNLLWKHDMNREIQELEIYHALLQRTNPAEMNLKKRLFYAEYKIRLQKEEYEKRIPNSELIGVGLSNIFRWCAPLAIPILKGQQVENWQYVLLAERKEQFPDIVDLRGRIVNLMELKAEITLICCVDAKEIIQNVPEDTKQDEIADRVIVKAKEYISQNLSNNISRMDVANYVHLDSSYFSKYFKKKVGMNFQDYLLQQRMEKVKLLLEQGYKVQDVIRETGFQNRNYFNQVFKQYTGCSPSEYRIGKEEERDRQ